MPGWTCCDAWEKWEVWTDETRAIAAASMKDQALRLRTHPGVYVWLYGSDNPPPAAIERMYLGILKDAEWPNPSVSSASEQPTPVTGSSGVKMTGPYEYVPPVYWVRGQGGRRRARIQHGDKSRAGDSYAGEREKIYSQRATCGRMDDVWNYHAGGERFTDVNVLRTA